MEFRLLTVDSEKLEFVRGWEHAFNRSFDMQDYEWIFDSRNLVYGAFDQTVLCAGYCILQSRAVFHGQLVKSGLCNNVFVTPEYQGCHLFTKLGRHVLLKAGERGIKILVGLPNENSLPGHRRVGWTTFPKNYYLEKKVEDVEFDPLEDERIMSITPLNFPLWKEAFSEFVLRIPAGRSFSIIKEVNYFSWRYLKRASGNYKIFIYQEEGTVRGYVVYKYYQPSKRIHILDVEAENEAVFLELLKAAGTIKEPVSLINVLSSTFYADYFKRAGFSKSTEYSNLIAYTPLTKAPVSLGDTCNLVIGDNEVF
ncbi:GNAT family N-acetyltransferase [Clostridium boliviensis]|uniref:GNAT family N-acetyltransferase n=1 Tax=Clostridium boliviensis TaxID=318465 RepID=A0ABU4GKD0_9CLOT|nr:GNAT family N-acetyltransferase [Clostridium boliviensis]MDW2798068.1 GNAT family N-acetyltransferase [Clostridium boliviensis]